MKKIILSAVVLSLAVAVHAQEIPERKTERPVMHDRMHGKRKGGHDRQEMMKQLNLTDAQKEQFKAQREEFKKKMGDLKKNDNITVKEWKSRMEGLRNEQRSKIDGILTTEQKAKMEKIKAESKEKHERMQKQHADKMKATLGLTEEQSAKLDKQRAEMSAKMKAIHEDKALSDEQKKEKMKELMKQRKESMKSILTEEQQKKLKESKEKEHHMRGKRMEDKKEPI